VKLKTIELVGFKSFAKKSKLDFSVPVVGIVGPNGSGKSNVVEAFRFVLGEQSMKSLRGKSGADLIFKGSKDLPKGNRASVEIVFDNKDRVFKMSDRSEPLNLDFDDITIKREVFTDGTNTYSINGSTVRLRDIVDMLSSVNIGASGHHIISQGQADRILTSSAKDRRTMIEDALGLKVYQNKLKDSAKKLEKTEENMKEVGLLRRELAPHIKYLKKQVEKVEKSAELRAELSKLYLQFFKSEETFLVHEEAYLKNTNHEQERELKEIEVKLAAMKAPAHVSFEEDKQREITDIEKEIAALERTKEELSRKLGRIEGMIEFQNKDAGSAGIATLSIKSTELENFLSDVSATLDRSLLDADLGSVKDTLRALKTSITIFGERFKNTAARGKDTEAVKDLEVTKREVGVQLAEIDGMKQKLVERAGVIRQSLESRRSEVFKDQEQKYILETKKSKILAEEEIMKNRLENFHRRKIAFEESIKEAVVLVGREILDYKDAQALGEVSDDMRREIEKLKIRLEDAGTGGGEDIIKEYENITERDAFLSKELEDLEKSIANLRGLIDDLKETLDTEFKTGLEKINARFEEFFKLMFGGGAAYLSNIVQGTKKNDLDEDEESSDSLLDDEEKLDYGIEINVTLPQKKVKDLAMLSGGERSLTSIALVFAMTQVNPPPFLVLDETDAALDEANSKRYGDMIEILSKYSSLITVTHNRETMSRADVIYGVTIGADGGSKLLSIKFSDAENYAK
jgi:chromosome segregation protein